MWMNKYLHLAFDEVTNTTLKIWCNPNIQTSCISGFGYYLSMPAFFILIFGVQFRATRRGVVIGGYGGFGVAVFAALTFTTLTG